MRPTDPIRPALFALCALPCGAWGDPLAEGRALYDENCAACHMEDGSGSDLEPDIRGAPRGMVKRALGGMDSMPEFDFTEAELDSLLAYLDALDTPR